jgi:hypothetical protein
MLNGFSKGIQLRRVSLVLTNFPEVTCIHTNSNTETCIKLFVVKNVPDKPCSRHSDVKSDSKNSKLISSLAIS